MPSEPLPVRTATRMLEVKQQAQGSLLASLVRFVRNVLAMLGPDDEPGEAVTMIVDAVEAGKRQVADLASVYVSTVLALDADAKTSPDIDRDSLEEQWHDLVDRWLQERTDELMDEIDQALAEEVQGSSHRAVRTPTAIGYRRVIHPERSESGVCGLCVAAAHRLYHTPDLKKIHDGCKCTVLPVTSETDLGKEINDADLATAYDAGGTSDGWTLKQVRFKPGDDGRLVAVKKRDASGKRKPRDEHEQAKSRSASSGRRKANRGATVEAKAKASLQDRIASLEAYIADPANAANPHGLDLARKQLQRTRAVLADRFPDRR